ncbi:shTK domain protein [Ancylostoma caninum]|uniref:ShTK domain protein n=1 Tax=Ancylostoma caninum TaxID=29170 RepID=A0A368FJC6_ANCCA|nr:shTK domain protein [Ancylostoma caninum]
MISSKNALDMERRFRRANITYDIRVPDVEKLIIRNERTVKRKGYGRRLHDDPILDSEPDGDQSRVGKLKKAKYSFGDYASYADMMKYMRTIEFYYPNITKIVRLGVTHEGKPIEGMKIGYPISDTNKRAIWVDGNIHAREWASSHTALYFINQLVSGYGKDDTITHYVNSLTFYVMPCLNPDGYEYTRSSPNPSVRLWRKNRSPEKCHRSLWGGEKCCQGVDLNRNFKFHWAESGSSYEPCSNIYHGDHVFSEPESRAVRDFLDSDELRGKVDGFITLHSYAQLWIYPYSHAQQNYPEDISELRRTARRAINRLHRQYGTEYRMGTGADTLSPASGGSDDWAKANGIKYVYLVELRPEYELSNGFILHKKELIPTAVETFEGVKEVIEAVLEHNKIRRDPLSRIAPQLRRKQLYRMHLLGMANGMKSTLAGSAKFATTPTTTTQPTTTTPPQRTTTPPMRTTTPDLETAVPTRARPWLTYKPRDRHTTKWRSMHFDKYTTTVGVPEITAPLRTSTVMEEVTGEPVRIEGDVTTMPPPSDEVTSTDQPTLTTMSRQTTEIVFFTHTRPSTFRDPKCRDMRYSCAFWLQHNPVVCTEQESFMKAQCAYTCKFCISELDAKDAQEIARKKH